MREALANLIAMVASDGMPITSSKVHPRGQGTFPRVLDHYVREEKLLDLMTALRKMTLLPAQRLEKHVCAFQNTGRIRSTKRPLKIRSNIRGGIPSVLVNGVPVIREEKSVHRAGCFSGARRSRSRKCNRVGNIVIQI